MKSILFAILVLFATVSVANPIRLEVPEQCAPEVQMASFVLQYYDQGTTREEFDEFVDNMAEHPDAVPEVVQYTRELLDLIYGFEPKEREDFISVYQVVIERCVYEKQRDPDLRV